MLNNDRHMHFMPPGMSTVVPGRHALLDAPYVEPAPLAAASDYGTLMAAVAEVVDGSASGILCTDGAAKAVSISFGKLRQVETSFKGTLLSIPATILGIALASGDPALRLGSILTQAFWKTVYGKGGSVLAAKVAQDVYMAGTKLGNARELPYGGLCVSLWWRGWRISDNLGDTLVIAPADARLPLSRGPA